MIFPPERIAEVCALGPVKASELLDRGRAGDLQALADWSVRAMFKKFRAFGAARAEALHHTRVFLDQMDLKAKVSL